MAGHVNDVPPESKVKRWAAGAAPGPQISVLACRSPRLKVMKWILLLIAALAAGAQDLYADSPRTPFPYVVTVGEGKVYFRMFPRPRAGNHSDGYGVAYRVRNNGSDEVLWRTQGWYSTEVFLSDDGYFLVAIGPWNGGSQPRKEDLALSFYSDGKLIKQYSTADLVRTGRKYVDRVATIPGLHVTASCCDNPSLES